MRLTQSINPLAAIGLLVFSVGTSYAQTEAEETSLPAYELAAEGYCDYVIGAANSEAALKFAPRIFVGAGVVAQTEDIEINGESETRRFLRLQVGAEYSLGDVRRGMLGMSLAHRKCERYKTTSALYSVVRHQEALEIKALQAKIATLEQAIEEGDKLIARAQLGLRKGTNTRDELNVLVVWKDDLSESLSEALRRLKVATQGTLPKASVGELLEKRANLERAVGRSEGKLRQAQAWDLRFIGAYDEILDADDRVPFYGTVELSLNLGALFQRPQDNRATRGRVQWTKHQQEGANYRVEFEVQKLQGILEADRKRLGEATILLNDVRQSEADISNIPSPSKIVMRFRSRLWFQRAKLESEVAYLSAHIADIEAFLGQ